MLITKLSTVLSAALFLAASGPSARATSAAPLQACTGCVASGGSSSMSSGTGAGFVSVSVTVTNGKCKWFLDYETWILTCTQFKACTQSTSSTWGSLASGSVLDLCVQAGDEVTRCDAPPVTVGASGAGSSLMSTQIPCGAESGSGLVYSVVSESAGLSASATVSCSACEG